MRVVLFSFVFVLAVFMLSANVSAARACWNQALPDADVSWATSFDLAVNSPTDLFILGGSSPFTVKHYDSAAGLWRVLRTYGNLTRRDGIAPFSVFNTLVVAGRNSSGQLQINVIDNNIGVAYRDVINARTTAGARIPYTFLSFKAFIKSGSNYYAILHHLTDNYDVVVYRVPATREWVGKQFSQTISSWAPATGGDLLIGTVNGFVQRITPAITSSTVGDVLTGGPIVAVGMTDSGIIYAGRGDPGAPDSYFVYRLVTPPHWSQVNLAFYYLNANVNDVFYSFYGTSSYAFIANAISNNYSSRSLPFSAIKAAKTGSDVFVLTAGNTGKIYKLICANNAAPVLNAGANVPSVFRGVQVDLRGTFTDSDTDGLASAYWSLISGDPAGYSVVAGSLRSLFVGVRFTRLGTYAFKLNGTDDGFPNRTGFSAPKTITVVNSLPTANAGADRSMEANSLETLNGAGLDSDGTIASYRWSITSGDETKVIQRTPEAFDARDVTFNVTSAGEYTFQLTVTDNDGASTTDEVTLTVNAPPEVPPAPVAPTADARILKDGATVTEVSLTDEAAEDRPTVVQLNASTTLNPDARPLTFKWNVTSGNASAVYNYTPLNLEAAQVSFTSNGTFTFTLNVTDDRGLSSTDAVTLRVVAAAAAIAPECTSDVNCSEGFECSAGSCVAIANVTEECISDSDCSEGFQCIAGSCVAAGVACTDNNGCEGTEECLAGSCIELSCGPGEEAVAHECLLAGEQQPRPRETIRCGGADRVIGTGMCCNNVWIPGVSQCPQREVNRTVTPTPQPSGEGAFPFLIVGGIIVLLAIVAAAYFLFIKKPPAGGEKAAGEEAESEAEEQSETATSSEEPVEENGGEEKRRKWI